jgi:hypothetical protein
MLTKLFQQKPTCFLPSGKNKKIGAKIIHFLRHFSSSLDMAQNIGLCETLGAHIE